MNKHPEAGPPRRARRRRRERGQTVVELALLLPVLVTIIYASLELARIYIVQQHLVSAAQMGARTGTIRNSTIADVQNALTTYLAETEVGASFTPTISGVDPAADFNTNVTVGVAYNLRLFSTLPLPGFSGFVVPLSASVTMRHQ